MYPSIVYRTNRKKMKVKRAKFGILGNGKKAYLYTVKNKDMSFCVTNFGCTITSILAPAKDGTKADVVLGCSTLSAYADIGTPFFGAFIGRFANRIANASFNLNRCTYTLDKNDGNNCLHGGFIGYDKMLFDSEEIKTKEGVGVRFTRKSPSGEQGFPGTVYLEVTYVLTKENEIILSYKAMTDRDTPINLTNHTYFNLTGDARKTIFDHLLTINADSYLEVNKDLIPTGKFIKVDDDGAFDFRTAKKIGKDFEKTNGGYDHNFVLNKTESPLLYGLPFCAEVYEETSERRLKVWTNQPGVQFYSGNSLAGAHGRLGQIHLPHQGFCLETQQFPDAPNKANFPSCILHPDEEFEAKTVYAFSVG